MAEINEHWMPAYSTDKIYMAERAMSLLTDEGIESYIINKSDSVLPVGDIEVFVHRDSLLRAKHLLKDIEA
jgi:hypothetical protein